MSFWCHHIDQKINEIYFVDFTSFYRLWQKSLQKIRCCFSVDLVPPKRDFDINWPLKGDSKWYDQIPTTLYIEDDDNWIRIDIARKKLSHLPNIKEP